VRLSALFPFANRAELEGRLAVSLASHRFLCPNERVDREDPTATARQLHRNTAGGDLLVRAETQDLAQAVQLAPVGVEVEVA
jgi:hypothetical protein